MLANINFADLEQQTKLLTPQLKLFYIRNTRAATVGSWDHASVQEPAPKQNYWHVK